MIVTPVNRLLLHHYYLLLLKQKTTITYYYRNKGPIITVIMKSLLSIITRSIMGNHGTIITFYQLPQLGDEVIKKHIGYSCGYSETF